jgi:LCP family protein required for cell wall assembly
MDRERREPEAIRRKKRRRTPEEIEEMRKRQKRRLSPEQIEEMRRKKRLREERGQTERRRPAEARPRRPRVMDDEEQARKNPSVKKRMKISLLKKVLIGIAAVLALIIISGIISILSFVGKIDNKDMLAATKPESGGPVNILVLGMDIGDTKQVENMSIKRTDTMMLINYNPNTKTTQIVSIPRDTLVKENGENYKINAAFQKGGNAKVKQVVENMLNININYMINVDYAAFRGFIDAIGGIDMEIDRDMIYDDEGQNLHINFKAGTVEHLDGQKAEEFFRWRKNNDGTGLATGDLGRIENQHKFFEKVTEKCSSPLMIFKVSKILNVVATNMKSNMSAFDDIYYGLKIIFSKSNGIQMTTIQGDVKMISGQSYVVFDKSLNTDLLNSLKSSSGNTQSKINKESTKIMILNGTNINGLASQVKTDLAVAGFSKVDTGNATQVDKSTIKTDNSTLKDEINKALPKVTKSEGKDESTKYSDYDAVIVIGADYRK